MLATNYDYLQNWMNLVQRFGPVQQHAVHAVNKEIKSLLAKKENIKEKEILVTGSIEHKFL